MPRRAARSAYLAAVALLAATGFTLATATQPAVAAIDQHGPGSVADYSGLSQAQRADLRAIAGDTWKFYSADVDPTRTCRWTT